MLKLDLTLEEKILAAIPAEGTTWGVLRDTFPAIDDWAIAKVIRMYSSQGITFMEPKLFVRRARITNMLAIAGDVLEVIPHSKITFGDLKAALPPEEHEGELLAMLAVLRATGQINITPRKLIDDDSVIERISAEDKVVPFKSRRKSA